MFTGLVEEVGIVRRLERGREGGRLSVRARTVLEGTKVGDSIAVSGACLTVVELDRDGFTVECMPETLARTTLGRAGPGSSVNLERSLVWGGRLGGHLVLGHVDEVGEVLAVQRRGISWVVRISLPAAVAGCVTAKGSVAVDGISLTVLSADGQGFEVGVIPHTLRETTLRDVKVGMQVNLEADVLARYVLQGLQTLTGGVSTGVPAFGSLTEEFLREQGFA
jgi:riboflavin synthase